MQQTMHIENAQYMYRRFMEVVHWVLQNIYDQEILEMCLWFVHSNSTTSTHGVGPKKIFLSVYRFLLHSKR